MSNRAQAAASQVATSKEQEAAALLNLTLQTNASLLELKDLQLRDLPPAFAQVGVHLAERRAIQQLEVFVYCRIP
jgi:hypothetical protein